MYKTGKILLAIVVVLGLVGVYRACSTSALEKRVWKIARDRDWREVRVPGMRRDFLGFSDELIRAIAKEKRLSVEFYGVSFNNLNWVLEKQTYDAILTNLPPSSINRQKFLFSDPYYLLGPILVTRVDQEVESIDDMRGKTVAVQRGSRFLMEPHPELELLLAPYDSLSYAYSDLASGFIDGLVVDQFSAYNATEGVFKDILKVSSKPLTIEGVRLVVLKGSEAEELVPVFNNGLEKVKQSGTYLELLKRWGFTNGNIPDQTKS